MNRNLEFLSQVLNHYKRLSEQYGMESLNMAELGAALGVPARSSETSPERVFG